MAVLEVMVDKGQLGKFLLETYKTIVGQKVQVGPMKPIPALEWNQ